MQTKNQSGDWFLPKIKTLEGGEAESVETTSP